MSNYEGPSVFGYETDALRRVAVISVHTSPLANLGSTDAGGMNVYVRELSCHIGRLGLPLDIFTRRSDPATPRVQQLCDNVRVIAIDAGPVAPVHKHDLFDLLPDFAEEMALFALRDGVRYDIVHAHYWLSGWVAHLLERYWNVPFSLMFHTTAHMKNAATPGAPLEPPLRARIEKELVGLASNIIAGNPDEAADLIWRQHGRAERICTIPPGVDTELFRPLDRGEARASLGIADDDRVVAFVGRVDPIKGIDVLLDAVVELRARCGDRLQVLFVGGDLDASSLPIGPLASVAASANALGISTNIRFLGARPQSFLPTLYNAADVVCVPSRYESFGLVAVEAMACGVPVVASRAGGLVFTIDDGDNGFLAEPGDARGFADHLARLLGDDELRVRMGARARESTLRFAWSEIADSVYHVYRRLAAGHRADLCCKEEIYA